MTAVVSVIVSHDEMRFTRLDYSEQKPPNFRLHPTVRLLRASLRSALAARPAGEPSVRQALRQVRHGTIASPWGIALAPALLTLRPKS